MKIELEIKTDAVKKLLFDNCMSISDLSKKSGVPIATTQRFVSGNVSPRTTTLKKICDCLGCKPEEITTIKGDKGE